MQVKINDVIKLDMRGYEGYTGRVLKTHLRGFHYEILNREKVVVSESNYMMYINVPNQN